MRISILCRDGRTKRILGALMVTRMSRLNLQDPILRSVAFTRVCIYDQLPILSSHS
jgi:hypothetical protein